MDNLMPLSWPQNVTSQDGPLESLLQQNGGWLTHRQVVDAGFDPHLLNKAELEGKLERLQRGVYRAVDALPVGHDDLLEVQLRFPHAIPCMVSALSFHGLTVQNPSTVEIAVTRGRHAPKLDYPPLTVYTFGAWYFSYGLEHYPLGTHFLRTYTPEKTLCDLLRFEKRLGKEIFLEGLKNYLRARAGHKVNIPLLLEAAKVCKVEAKMKATLEVLL